MKTNFKALMTRIKYDHLNKEKTVTPESYDPNLLVNALLSKMRLKRDNELAEQLDLDVKTIARIRENRLKISQSMLVLIAEATGLSVVELRKMLRDKRENTAGEYMLPERRR